MKAIIDMHTHTVASGHAYSTIHENVQFAKKHGIKILGMSDHGPDMLGGPQLYFFNNLISEFMSCYLFHNIFS